MGGYQAIADYWRACQERGEKPKPAYAAIWRGVSREAGQEPGQIIVWSLYRKIIKDYAKTCGLRLCYVAKIEQI